MVPDQRSWHGSRWRKGTENTAVDCFSRHPTETPCSHDEEDEVELDNHVKVIRCSNLFDIEDGDEILNLDNILVSNVRDEALQDTSYVKLVEAVRNGFPDERVQVDADFVSYWSLRHRLTVDNGIVLFGQRMVIPKRLRSSVQDLFMFLHLGPGFEICVSCSNGFPFCAQSYRRIE